MNRYKNITSDIKSEAVLLTPGSSWSKQAGFYIAPKFAQTQHLSEPLKDSISVPVEKVIVMGQNFVKKRRQQLLANLLHHPAVLLLLATLYTIHLTDIDCYLQMQLLHPKGVYRLSGSPVKSTVVHISSNDAYDLFAGKIDAEIMVMAGRIRISQNKSQWDLIKVYAWEYLFVKDDYSELQAG